MITEDLVSFEVGKLLKQKGFDEPCRNVYEEKNLRTNTLCDYLNSELSSYVCAPTLQMAMKWLREVHNLWIDIDPLSCNEWAWSIWLMYDPDFKTGESLRNTSSYEEACEEAIKYTLENLI